jgi:hypothetical protein
MYIFDQACLNGAAPEMGQAFGWPATRKVCEAHLIEVNIRGTTRIGAQA